MHRSLVLLLAGLAAALATIPAAPAQAAPDALLYHDGTAGLKPAFDAFANQLSLQGSLVETTDDASAFSDALAAGEYGVYGAFAADEALLDVWLASAPANVHFLKATLDAAGEVDSEYVSFLSPTAGLSAGGGRRVVGSSRGGSLVITKVEDFSTETRDGRPAPAGTLPADEEPAPTGSIGGSRATGAAAAAVGWPWDGIVEAITDFFSGWFQDILEWLQCVGNCAAGCVNTFLDQIPEGVEVEITVEVQTTPPGVKTSITVKANGQAAVQVMRAYAEMIKCLGGCVASCTGQAGN